MRVELTHRVRRLLHRAEVSLRADEAGAVHEARKAVKQVRALAAFLVLAGGDVPQDDVRRLRKAGRRLSDLRDAEVMLDTFALLCAGGPGRLPADVRLSIQHRLESRRTELAEKAAASGRHVKVADALRRVHRSAAAWTCPRLDVTDLPHLLRVSYREARLALEPVLASTRGRDVHYLRKRVKTLWYQWRLLDARVPGLHAEVHRLGALGARLGEYHDLSLLDEVLRHDRDLRALPEDAVHQVRAIREGFQRALRRTASVDGARAFKERPKVLAHRLDRLVSRHAEPRPA